MTKHILVADDDDGIVDALTIMLEMNDYQVSTGKGKDTVEKIRQKLPDLVLLDIWMAGQDGREICRDLKSHEETKHIPVIMISASRDVQKDAFASGADDFVAKPFEMEELLSKVDEHLKKSH
jgi:DNA-binding response OmpR family regulator